MRFVSAVLARLSSNGGRRRRGVVGRGLEELERRITPTLLFGVPGTQKAQDYGGRVLTSADVELVFWGKGWSAPGLQAPESLIVSDVKALFSTPYLSALTQYRSDIATTGRLLDVVNISDTSPPSLVAESNFATMLKNHIAGGALPAPDSDPNLIYIVIPQAGTLADGEFGEHGTGKYTPEGGPAQPFVFGWSINDDNIDTVMTTYSHELVESVSDPVPATGIAFPDGSELADRNAIRFNYYLQGTFDGAPYKVDVQAYYSLRDQAYILPDGNSQVFQCDSSGTLTIDRSASASDDAFSVATTATGGLRVAVNGEAVDFEPNLYALFDAPGYTGVNTGVNAVVIDAGGGRDVFDLDSTFANNPVTIVGGSGPERFNVPADASLLAPVTITGGAGNNLLAVGLPSNTWMITGVNSGTVGNVTFSGIANLAGGTGTDRFALARGSGLTGAIDGGPGPGKNYLDYSAFSKRRPVAVTLKSRHAPGIRGGIKHINKAIR